MRMALLAAATFGVATMASADVQFVLTGAESDGGEFTAYTLLTFDVADEPAVIDGCAFDLDYTTNPDGMSYGSEANIGITSPEGTYVVYDMGDLMGWGTGGNWTGYADVTDFDGENPNGHWVVKFFEDYDDTPTPDGTYNESYFNVFTVPAPGTLALLGLAGFVSRRRR
ncbi:MAG: PEP-CTERM sorting domain-containing protein [Phycisphaerales bacterium]|nr:PEP-CTERM sorting domain-containing protein [Phycisphaerales bacterium]